MNKRIALVTGGVGGIGTAICKRLAQDGHFVVANYAIPGTEDRWHKAMNAAGLNGSTSALAFGDVTDYAAMGEMVDKIEAEHGAVDILVNCAGITRDARFTKMTLQQWREVMASNLDSVFNATRPVFEGMCQRGFGRIVNISSVYGLFGGVNRVDYVTTKTALIGFTRAIALETARANITCNAICPGTIPTPNIEGRLEAERAKSGQSREETERAFLETRQPSGKFVAPDRVAALVALLCGPSGADITGSAIPIDGGWSAS